MKTLDRYVAKSFITGYFISFMVLIGLCIVVDFFVNIDEFAEHTDKGVMTVLMNIGSYYASESAVYFRDLAGMITVLAAVFSLGKMTKHNELIAVMASGVSLKRVIAPIILLAILFTSFHVIDQEIIIPRLANMLVRDQDYDADKGNVYSVWFMDDTQGSLICTTRYIEKTETMTNPTFILRQHGQKLNDWTVIGKIKADSAVYNHEKERWDLKNGVRTILNVNAGTTEERLPKFDIVEHFATDVTPDQIPLRRQESYKAMLSSSQLANLANQETKIKDQAELISQQNFRITDPIINMIMLMIALPVLVCRDPKAMKPAIAKSFAITALCFLVTFGCKMVSTEQFIFDRIWPELWAWLPILIFFPIALIEIDSMKT
ncbi:MAG: LptF/LptG family permease [Phycisphaerae bacterium]|nr:LptF/LptG family permease [Phycisphaerae bacterium]